MELSEEPMYDPNLLKKLDFRQADTIFNPPVTAAEPGEFLLVRPLCSADFNRGMIKILFIYRNVINCLRHYLLSL